MTNLALFDLDHTLLPLDSDFEWGQFLARTGAVDANEMEKRNADFYRQYQAGTLDPVLYLEFVFGILSQFPRTQLDAWHGQFMDEVITPAIRPAARELVKKHQDAGDLVAIITATNRFVTAPIARRLGVRVLLATECEVRDGRYTGRSTDIPCFREGKVTRLERWMLENGFDLEDSYFYSDSMNDLPLLQRVAHAVAVDPDPKLRAEAEMRGWPVVSLRD